MFLGHQYKIMVDKYDPGHSGNYTRSKVSPIHNYKDWNVWKEQSNCFYNKLNLSSLNLVCITNGGKFNKIIHTNFHKMRNNSPIATSTWDQIMPHGCFAPKPIILVGYWGRCKSGSTYQEKDQRRIQNLLGWDSKWRLKTEISWGRKENS